jgi:membrane dipeptidase
MHRREFLTSVAAASVASLGRAHATEIDPRVTQILARTITVDMHNHVEIPFGKPDAPLPDLDLPAEMKRAGVAAVVQTWNIDAAPAAQPGDDYAHFQQGLAFEDRLLARAKMNRALTLKDLQNAHARSQPIIIQGAEGAQFLEGHVERIEEAYKRGLRVLQIIHDRDDKVKPLGDIYTAAAHLNGLTEFGAEAIKTCNRLGIVVDLTHAAYDTVKAALKVSSQPMMFSHTGLKPQPGERPVQGDMEKRLVSKEEARDIGNAGGIIGIWWHGPESVKEYVESIRHMVETIGVDHVGLGTDSDIEAHARLPFTNGIWKDQTTGFFYAVATEMLAQGFKPDEISKIGGANFCRLFGKVARG